MKSIKGKFVVVEGNNGAGKTTTVHAALALLGADNILYNKGFTNNSFWSSFIHQHPHSFTYYLDLALNTQRQIKPRVAQGMTIVQDRYVQTVDSFLPDSEWAHNRALRKVLSPIFLNADLYIYMTASVEDIIRRLSQSATDEYRLGLVRHPEKIERREEKYRWIYDSLAYPKQMLDTSGRAVDDCAQELVNILRRELPCS